MLTRDFPLAATPPVGRRTRNALATVLRSASLALDRLAQGLAHTVRHPVTEPVLEFHGEAGAPEGALYVDGQLVGHVLGVNRL